MITDLDAPVWTGREPCVDPSHDPDWWSNQPSTPSVRADILAQRRKAQELCQDCPHSSWLLCARKALEGEGTHTPAVGVWAGVWVDSTRNLRKRSEREEAVAELKAIVATGVAVVIPLTVPLLNVRKPVGRPQAMDATSIVAARQLHDCGSSFAMIAARFGVSRSTVHRSLKANSDGC